MIDSLIAYFGLASEYVNLFPVSVKELKENEIVLRRRKIHLRNENETDPPQKAARK